MEKKNEVNRTVDGDIAEGHIRHPLDSADKRSDKRQFVADDEETEGHLIVRQKR